MPSGLTVLTKDEIHLALFIDLYITNDTLSKAESFSPRSFAWVAVQYKPVQPDRKPTFARPSGTTTSATAPAAKRNTITDSSTASDRCYRRSSRVAC